MPGYHMPPPEFRQSLAQKTAVNSALSVKNGTFASVSTHSKEKT